MAFVIARVSLHWSSSIDLSEPQAIFSLLEILDHLVNQGKLPFPTSYFPESFLSVLSQSAWLKILNVILGSDEKLVELIFY